MKNAPRLLLSCLCLLSFATGCARDGEKDEPDNGKTETKVRNDEKTKQEAPTEDAEAVARKFVDAMNCAFKTDSEPMRKLKEEGFISEPLWAMLEVALREEGIGGFISDSYPLWFVFERARREKEKGPFKAHLSFNKNVPEKSRAVFEVLLREGESFETLTQVMELKKTGSRWVVSNYGWLSAVIPYDNAWEVKSPEKTVEEFFEAYKWIPREKGKDEEVNAVFFCAQRATDDWLNNSGWKIGEREHDGPDELALAIANSENEERREFRNKWKWHYSPESSPTETDIVWKRIRIDGVEFLGNKSVSLEFSRQSLANLPCDEEDALWDELMKGSVVSVSFLGERDETLFQRKFLLRPLNPESPVWVIVGEMGEDEPSNAVQAQKEKRNADPRSQDLCEQVADAWSNLAIQYKRFPQPDFILDMVGSGNGGKLLDEDIWIRMTPAACCLLNFWQCKSPIPAADRKFYEPKCGPGEYPTQESVESFGPFFELECETWQKCFGLYAPWVRKRIVSILADNGVRDPDGAHDAIVEAVSKDAGWADGVHCGYGVVAVALDTNGDGMLTIPGSLIGESEDVVLRRIAAAWVWNEKRTKTSRSW